MSADYQGTRGRANLAEALADQRFVRHNEQLAAQLAAVAEVQTKQPGEQLYVANAQGKLSLFFVIAGRVEITFQTRKLALLEAGEAIGEFPLLGPQFHAYAVTATAIEPTIVACVPHRKCLAILEADPRLWKNLAASLADRLLDMNRGATAAPPPLDVATLTTSQILGAVKPGHWWVIIPVLLSVIGAYTTVVFKAGQHFPDRTATAQVSAPAPSVVATVAASPTPAPTPQTKR